MVIRVLLAAKSLLILMVGRRRMVAVPFRERTQQRLTGRLPMLAAIWQKMLLQRAWHHVAQFRSPMRLALPSRYRFMRTHMARAQLTIKNCKKRFAIAWIGR